MPGIKHVSVVVDAGGTWVMSSKSNSDVDPQLAAMLLATDYAKYRRAIVQNSTEPDGKTTIIAEARKFAQFVENVGVKLTLVTDVNTNLNGAKTTVEEEIKKMMESE